MKILLLAALLTSTIFGQTKPPTGHEIIFGGQGAVAQVADGDGWRTTITIVNLDPTIAPYTLTFYADNGSLLSLTTSLGTSATFSGSIPPNGSVTIATAGLQTALSQGWAALGTSARIGGTVYFQRVALGQPNYEASEPIDTELQNHFRLPFDHTNGNVTGFAVLNPFSYTSINVFVTFRDQNGNQVLLDSFSLSPFQHAAFTLTQRYPQTIGLRGTVDVSTSALWLNVIGLHFGPSGVFSTIIPLSSFP